MLGDKDSPPKQSHPYDDFDRLLDEIIKAEDDFTCEIRFFTQRLADMETRMHKSIAELMRTINDRDLNSKAM